MFSPVPFHPVPLRSPSPSPPPLENDAGEQEGTAAIAVESVQRKGPVALLQGIVNECLRRLFYPNDVCSQFSIQLKLFLL